MAEDTVAPRASPANAADHQSEAEEGNATMNMMTTINPARATATNFPYGDAAIEAAWAEHRRLMRARFAYLAELKDDESGNAPHHDLVARLEATIVNTPATTLRGVEIKLLVALDHSSGWGHALTTETQHYLPDENFDGLARVLPALDLDAKCIATAILSLRAMQPDSSAWDAAYADWLEVEREWDRLSETAMPDGEVGKAPEAKAAWNEMQGAPRNFKPRAMPSCGCPRPTSERWRSNRPSHCPPWQTSMPLSWRLILHASSARKRAPQA